MGMSLEIQKMDSTWFKHILFIIRHDKRIGQSKNLCLALSMMDSTWQEFKNTCCLPYTVTIQLSLVK